MKLISFLLLIAGFTVSAFCAEAETFSAEALMGKVNAAKDTGFASVPRAYCSQDGFYLRKTALQAFLRMREAAAKDGVKLLIVSAFRSFNDQKGIWESKWTGARLVEGKNLAKTVKDPVERAFRILRFSSMPGSSRHHWGTDIDLNALEDSYFQSGKGKTEFDWLTAHAAGFGFARPYSPKGESRPTGYEEEKWHWSYVPVSRLMLGAWLSNVTDKDIRGFAGSDMAAQVRIIQDYVAGVDVSCR